MIYRLILLALLAAVGATAATIPKTVTAERTSGELLWPTNLFSVNTNALVAALSDHFGTGGMPAGVYTNTDSYAALVADVASRTNQCLPALGRLRADRDAVERDGCIHHWQ